MTACTRGRTAATCRAVNAFAASRRSRVCSGGSMLRRESACWISGLDRGTSLPTAAALLSRESESAARTSAYRVTSQASPPCGIVTRVTGSSLRSLA